jgi:hypothetical protein
MEEDIFRLGLVNGLLQVVTPVLFYYTGTAEPGASAALILSGIIVLASVFTARASRSPSRTASLALLMGLSPLTYAWIILYESQAFEYRPVVPPILVFIVVYLVYPALALVIIREAVRPPGRK